MQISRSFFLFMLYSAMGWIFESTFCTVRDGRWEDRGFLYGPVCPIYGAGAMAAAWAAGAAASLLDGGVPVWAAYVVSVLGSAVLEFGTSWILEKMFHAVWWDYSRLPFNIQGRISLFTSLGFGVAGVTIIYGIAPVTEGVVDRIPDAGIEILALASMAVFSADLTLTVSALTDFAGIVERAQGTLDGRMEVLVEDAHQRTVEARERMEQERERMRRRLGEMSRARQLAVRRVRALRYPKIGEERLEQALEDLREVIRSRRGE